MTDDALIIAKEITIVAVLRMDSLAPTEGGGNCAGEFFKGVLKNVREAIEEHREGKSKTPQVKHF